MFVLLGDCRHHIINAKTNMRTAQHTDALDMMYHADRVVQ